MRGPVSSHDKAALIGGRQRKPWAVFAVLSALWASTASVAAAETDEPFAVIPGTELNTFYAGDGEDYPVVSVDVPVGCEAEGSDLVLGERFATMSAPDHWVEDLRRINFGGLEEVVVMEWDSIAAGCEGGHISLSLKNSHDTVFDIDDDQHAIASVACNAPLTPRCQDIGNRLVLPASLHGVMPCFQVDAHFGRQLRIIGPGQGFYYSFLNRNHDVLIGAKNGGFPPCTIDNPLLDGYSSIAIASCPHDPTLPAAAMECRATTPTTTAASMPLATTTSTAATAPPTSPTTQLAIAPPPFLARAAPTVTTTSSTTVTTPMVTAPPATTAPTTVPATATTMVSATAPPAPLMLPRTGTTGGQRDLALVGWLTLACGFGIAGVGRHFSSREPG